MSKPETLFLLEVSYPEGRFHLAPTGGVFRSDRDMNARISNIRQRARKAKKPVSIRISVSEPRWRHIRDEEINS